MSCCQSSFSKNGGGGAETGLLCEMFARGRDSLLAIGESQLGHSACYEKTLSLIPGAYHCGPHLTPSIAITSEI